ncbi:MAG: hypothetical protein KatS3mg115_1848 [Candidatus Poribacteria bacterium]|nr:MAG: hypothetical protein KatS3mg115_1848 [Candidatus Poribacteria bacterium]
MVLRALWMITSVWLFLLVFSVGWGQQRIVSQTTVTGVSRAFNPAISVNALLLGMTQLETGEGSHGETAPEESADHTPGPLEGSDEHAHESLDEETAHEAHGHSLGTEGLFVQEVEVRFTAFADPHVKADLTLSMHGAEGVELEEGYVQTLGLPANLLVRGGKFLVPFGKHNPLHTHEFPFVEPPLVHERLFGEEGLNEVGIEVSWLTPLPWYAEVGGALLNGDNPSLFDLERGLAYSGRVRNFFDWNETTTLELGLSGAFQRQEGRGWSRALGADWTVKWTPLETARHRAAVFQAEVVSGKDREGHSLFGGYGLVRVRLGRPWWVQGGFDWLGEEAFRSRARFALVFAPTEFQAIRFQYSVAWTSGEEVEADHRVAVQYNVTIGSHPAHAY